MVGLLTFEELDELTENLDKIKTSKSAKSSGKQKHKGINELLSWIDNLKKDFQQAMSTKYKIILDRKDMDLSDPETKTLMTFLESTHTEISVLKQNIADGLMSRLINVIKEQNILRQLNTELQKHETDIRYMEKKLEAFRKQESEVCYKQHQLEEMAAKPDAEFQSKALAGNESIGILAVSAAEAQFTGGLRLVDAGVRGEFAAHKLQSANEYQKAELMKEQVVQRRKKTERVQLDINKRNRETYKIVEQQQIATSSIGQLKNEQEILRNIVNQVIKFSDVIHSIVVVLRHTVD